MKINITHNKKVFVLYRFFFLVKEREKIKNVIKRIAVKIVPESNGKPSEFTKNTSKYPKSANVEGRRSLKMKSKIATDKTFAKRKFLKFGLGCFLKK